MNTLLGWLATYLIHSTVLLGLAWGVDRLLRGRPHWQEPIWKVALVGGLLTATVQTTSGLRPWGGTWTLDVDPAPRDETGITAMAITGRDAITHPREPAARDSSLPPIEGTGMVEAQTSNGSTTAPEIVLPRWSFGPAVLGVWAAGALLLLGILGNAWVALRRRLQGRRRLENDPLHRALSALVSREPRVAEPQLSATPEATVPMAMGLWRPEICLSERVIRELSPEAQESLLAHELGHLVRRDPLWRLVAGVIGRVFFFQPLNWLAARKLAACAELLADDWAARRTARPLALAECLTRVARWTMSPVRGLPVVAAVNGPSDLKQRVERLLRGEGLAPGTQRRVWAGPIAWCALAVLTLLAPTACGVAGRAPTAPTGPVIHAALPEGFADEVARDVEQEPDDNDAEEEDEPGDRAPSAERRKATGNQENNAQGHGDRARAGDSKRPPQGQDADEDDSDDDDDEAHGKDLAGMIAGELDEDDEHHGPIVVHVPSLNLDIDIDIDSDDPSIDEQLDALQDSLDKAREKRDEAHEKKEEARKGRERARQQRKEAHKKAREKARKDRDKARKEREKARGKPDKKASGGDEAESYETEGHEAESHEAEGGEIESGEVEGGQVEGGEIQRF